MKGTSGRLKSRHYMSIRDLLYGLMLPSGNDCALCLADHFGAIMKMGRREFESRL